MSAVRNMGSRRDAPHERAALIDRIAELIGDREIPIRIDGRAYRISIEAFFSHLSNAALVELEHAASAAALCMARLMAREDLRSGLFIDGAHVAQELIDVAADLVRLEALDLDRPVDPQDLVEALEAARTLRRERAAERDRQPDGDAGEAAPVGVREVAGGAHEISVLVDESVRTAARYVAASRARGARPLDSALDQLQPILEKIGAAT